MNYKITQFGKELSKDKYTFDEKTKTFSTLEDNLVLDFNGIDGVTFNTGSNCNFKTGFGCTFNTGSNCNFKTGFYCIFNTRFGCTFKTGSSCTFNTGSSCTFDTSYDCTFNTDEQCVLVRRDVYEIIELEKNVKIKLNGHLVKGYTKVEDTIKNTEDGQTIFYKMKILEKVKYNHYWYDKNIEPVFEYMIITKIRVKNNKIILINGLSVEGFSKITEKEKTLYFN